MSSRSSLKVVGDLGFKPSEADLEQEILEALGERTRLMRAAATAVLLGLLALLFIGNAIAVSLGVATAWMAGRITLAGVLLIVGAEMALIGYALRHPATRPIAEPRRSPAEPPHHRLTG